MDTDIKTQKRALRKLIRGHIAAMTAQQMQAEADKVFGTIELLPQFIAAKKVLLFYSLADEVPTHRAVERWAATRELYLPRVAGDDLELVRYDGTLSYDNAFHIGEPAGPAVMVEPDIVIVPGVAFDAHCRRLGRGRGYYDRLLAKIHPFAIGVALDCQIVDGDVPHEPHDLPLDMVVTASRTLHIQ